MSVQGQGRGSKKCIESGPSGWGPTPPKRSPRVLRTSPPMLSFTHARSRTLGIDHRVEHRSLGRPELGRPPSGGTAGEDRPV